MRIFEPTMTHEIDVFIQELLKTVGKPINIAPRCERLATDIAGQLAFGQPLNTQTQERNRLFPKSMRAMNFVVSVYST